MNRQKFLGIAGGKYLFSDKSNYVRSDSKQADLSTAKLTADERLILFLASLAPSGHNTQPCFIKHRGPFRWLVGNDKKRWLPGVDPTQRETILSIGAFLQNMEYAASSLGYVCQFDTLVKSKDENVVSVKLTKSGQAPAYDMQRIINRRTVRSNYLSTPLETADLTYLVNGETDFIHALPNYVKEHRWLNEQTIEANRIRSYRDVARRELADWIRFSGDDAATHRDGLTTAGMEIDGIPGWVLRNFYGKSAVMKPAFRDQSIDAVRKEVVNSAGWLLITSKGNDVATLLDTGRRMQRLFLRVRDRGIALHPMTQILEEAPTNQTVNESIGMSDPIQFILRTGYLKSTPNRFRFVGRSTGLCGDEKPTIIGMTMPNQSMDNSEISQLLSDENAHLEKLHKIVKETLKAEELIIHNLVNPPVETLTQGQKLSDQVAQFGGSWRFIILFGIILTGWIIFNVMAIGVYKFDPYPFILMNLILSCIAALQAPIIMMSQNRQEEKDRKRSENDYLINLKAEMQIRSINQKVDVLLEEQIKTLFETQEKQFMLLQEIKGQLDCLTANKAAIESH